MRHRDWFWICFLVFVAGVVAGNGLTSEQCDRRGYFTMPFDDITKYECRRIQ